MVSSLFIIYCLVLKIEANGKAMRRFCVLRLRHKNDRIAAVVLSFFHGSTSPLTKTELKQKAAYLFLIRFD